MNISGKFGSNLLSGFREEDLNVKTENWPEMIRSSISFLLLDRIDSNFGQFEIWVYTVQNIKKYCVLVEISWPEGLQIAWLHDLNNGKKHYSWRYFLYYWTELIQILVSLRCEYIQCTLQIIFFFKLCISGDILTWRTTNHAIAWPENGNTDL